MPSSRQHRCPNIGEGGSRGKVPTEMFVFLSCCLWSPRASSSAAIMQSHKGRKRSTESRLRVAQRFPIGSTLICGYGTLPWVQHPTPEQPPQRKPGFAQLIRALPRPIRQCLCWCCGAYDHDDTDLVLQFATWPPMLAGPTWPAPLEVSSAGAKWRKCTPSKDYTVPVRYPYGTRTVPVRYPLRYPLRFTVFAVNS